MNGSVQIAMLLAVNLLTRKKEEGSLGSATVAVYGSGNYQDSEDNYYERPEIISKVYFSNRGYAPKDDYYAYD